MEPGRIQRLAALLVTLGMLWLTLPEHQRRLILMRITHTLARATGRAAHREGHAGMADELARRNGEALRHYSAAYHLSRARDSFTRALDSLRP